MFVVDKSFDFCIIIQDFICLLTKSPLYKKRLNFDRLLLLLLFFFSNPFWSYITKLCSRDLFFWHHWPLKLLTPNRWFITKISQLCVYYNTNVCNTREREIRKKTSKGANISGTLGVNLWYLNGVHCTKYFILYYMCIAYWKDVEVYEQIGCDQWFTFNWRALRAMIDPLLQALFLI